MKTLTLLAAAVISLPAAAWAGGYGHDKHDRHHKTEKHMKQDDAYKMRVRSEEDFRRPAAQKMAFDLKNGGRLIIKDGKVYEAAANGTTHFAPTSTYITVGGSRIVVEDGLLMRIENPADMVYVDVDVNEDNIDIDTRTYER